MFENAENFAWLILLLPLAAAVVIALVTRGNPRRSGMLSIVASLGAFVTTLVLYKILQASGKDHFPPVQISWLSIGDFNVDIGLRLDWLSLVMALMVTGVGSLIQIYSTGYMADDRAYSRYFAGLSLFMFSMLGIVLSDNFIMLFIFWELVGVSSYLLIGHWYEKPAAADACKKAFLTNRIGDFGFLLGILIVWATVGTLNFQELETRLDFSSLHRGHAAAALLAHGVGFPSVATLAGLLIFCGAMGKSAQFPLHVWLPDAMEGPTPVSALIHAATMVAAGVYMLCRVAFLFDVPGSWALTVIASIGGFTSLLAALIAVQQNDIKRILAYSTLSQLGYMVMAVGLGGPTAAMFHLTTHAFFKALLFLGAGSVIYAMHHEQDIWKMGALKKKLPATYWTFLTGTLALCGVIPFSGFYSKDGILALAWHQANYPLFGVGIFVAFLTTFYMFRLVLVVFSGGERSGAAGHAHETPGVMTWPLRALAVLSAVGAFIGLEGIYAAFFEPAANHQVLDIFQQAIEPFKTAPVAAAAGLGAVIVGYGAAVKCYRGPQADPLPAKLGALSRAMANRFYFDEFYDRFLIPNTQEALAKFAGGVDRWLIGGFAVRFTHGATEIFGRALRMAQTGSLQTYALLLAAGVAVMMYFVLGK